MGDDYYNKPRGQFFYNANWMEVTYNEIQWRTFVL
jgi:hypothetical protein